MRAPPLATPTPTPSATSGAARCCSTTASTTSSPSVTRKTPAPLAATATPTSDGLRERTHVASQRTYHCRLISKFITSQRKLVRKMSGYMRRVTPRGAVSANKAPFRSHQGCHTSPWRSAVTFTSHLSLVGSPLLRGTNLASCMAETNNAGQRTRAQAVFSLRRSKCKPKLCRECALSSSRKKLRCCSTPCTSPPFIESSRTPASDPGRPT
mmetsp:Transcript_6241/g.22969  ORF Transcript_6241/g.22969 Transcript_6241/m.22969 type:complete len:211 (-) Transcript_6241:630-1262(-)